MGAKRMSFRKPPRYSPMRGFIKQALLRIGVPIAVILVCLYAAWLGGTRRERYVRQVADEWHAIRMNTPGMAREREREEIARRRARERDRETAQ
jgi:hypothetical protein